MSLLGLWARRCGKRAIAIFAGMAVLELVLFLISAYRSADGALLQIMELSRLMIAGFAAFLALTLSLALPSPQPELTLRRLRVTPRQAFLIRAAHNTLWYLVFWGVQLAVALMLCLLHRSIFPMAQGRQEIMLTFYRVQYLHALLPLGDWFLYIRNLLLFALMGCATAAEGAKRPYTCVGLSLTFGIYFPANMGLHNAAGLEITILAMLFVIAVICIVRIEDAPGEEAESDGAKA